MPPQAGIYTYTGTDADGKPQKWTVDDSVSRDRAATKVVSTLKTQDGKTAATTTSNWSSTQVLLTDIKIGDADCHWSPASPTALGLVAGKQWNIESSCVVAGQGYTVHVHEKGTGVAQRRVMAVIGSEQRPAWWVLTSVTLTIDMKSDKGDVTFTDKSRTNTLLVSSAGIAAQTDQYDDWSGFGKTKSTEQHMKLQSLSPA